MKALGLINLPRKMPDSLPDQDGLCAMLALILILKLTPMCILKLLAIVFVSAIVVINHVLYCRTRCRWATLDDLSIERFILLIDRSVSCSSTSTSR